MNESHAAILRMLLNLSVAGQPRVGLKLDGAYYMIGGHPCDTRAVEECIVRGWLTYQSDRYQWVTTRKGREVLAKLPAPLKYAKSALECGGYTAAQMRQFGVVRPA